MTVPATALAPARDHYYCYDASGRLTNVKTGGCGGTSVIGLGYDVQGNLANKNGVLHDFDFGNRLRSASNQETYRYDGLGRRVLGWSPTLGNLISQYNRAGQLVHQFDDRRDLHLDYIYLGGSLVAVQERPFAGGLAVRYQHTDALGTPVAVTDASRTVVERSEYEPYGKLLNRPLTDGPGYTGHVQDAATGLTYMQQRYYDPGIGRFLSVDPVTADPNTGANFNRYAYAFNNPYKFVDPDGRFGHIAAGGFVGGIIGGGVELYKQAKAGGDIQWGKVGSEAGKGVLVGAATAALPGAGAALNLGSNGTKALTAVGAVAAGSGGEAGAQAARGEPIDAAKVAIAGVANLAGVGAGGAAAAPARAVSTVTTDAIPGVAVQSLSGRTFTIGAVPATSSTSALQTQAIQDTVGETVSSATQEVANKLRDDRNR